MGERGRRRALQRRRPDLRRLRARRAARRHEHREQRRDPARRCSTATRPARAQRARQLLALPRRAADRLRPGAHGRPEGRRQDGDRARAGEPQVAQRRRSARSISPSSTPGRTPPRSGGSPTCRSSCRTAAGRSPRRCRRPARSSCRRSCRAPSRSATPTTRSTPSTRSASPARRSASSRSASRRSNLNQGGRPEIAAILAGFLLLALACAVLVSRSLQEQLAGFLDAARRLAGGDFSAQVTTVGHDEFAGLGEEFNKMARELKRRIEELREAVHESLTDDLTGLPNRRAFDVTLDQPRSATSAASAARSGSSCSTSTTSRRSTTRTATRRATRPARVRPRPARDVARDRPPGALRRRGVRAPAPRDRPRRRLRALRARAQGDRGAADPARRRLRDDARHGELRRGRDAREGLRVGGARDGRRHRALRGEAQRQEQVRAGEVNNSPPGEVGCRRDGTAGRSDPRASGAQTASRCRRR